MVTQLYKSIYIKTLGPPVKLVDHNKPVNIVKPDDNVEIICFRVNY